jgi:ABC-2 type transport system permease protein
MNLRPIYAIIYRYFSILKGSPDRVLGLYIWMLIDMVLWGFLSTYLSHILPPGFNAMSAFLGAVLLVNFFSRVMLNINMTFFEDMWARNLLNLFASPLRISEYLIGLIICGVITSTLGLVVVVFSASLLFGFSPTAHGAMVHPQKKHARKAYVPDSEGNTN